MTHSIATRSDPEAAFVAGYAAYPFSFETGRRAAQLWLATENAPLSLIDFRDSRWKAYACGSDYRYGEREAFNGGFASALAEHIAGGHHD